MQIRTARINDIDAITNIHFSAWQSVYKGHIPDNYLDALKLEDFSNQWQSYFKAQTNEILVLEDQKTVLGFTCFGPCDDQELQQSSTAEILYIYFEPNARGKGYGEILYREAEKMIKSKNYQFVCIKVLASNLQACRFYEKLGFYLDKVYHNNTKIKGVALSEKRYLMKP